MLLESQGFRLAVVFVIAIGVGVGYVNAQGSCTTVNRESGVCVPILTCGPIEQMLTTLPKPLPTSVIQFIQQSHCGTFDGTHHVCCLSNQVTGGAATTTTTTTAKPAVASGSAAIIPSQDKTDADVKVGMDILTGTFCGKSDADRVANGEDANLSEYPWMALLVYTDGLTRKLQCGGSLITDQYVLTAAHCIRVGRQQLVSVRLGEHDTREEIDCEGIGRKRKCAPPIQEIDIEEAIYHKDYNPTKFSDDIGLIRLVSKATIGASVRPICLPVTTNSQSASVPRMIIAGWGRIENGLRASVLQKAVVPIKTNEFCQKIHRLIQITEGQLCAGGENQVDTCKGDSGGPIFYAVRYQRSARYVQYGIVSAGSTICGSNFPGIYVRVTSYLPWIAGHIRA